MGPKITPSKNKVTVKESASEKKANSQPNKEKENKGHEQSEKSGKSAEKNEQIMKRSHETMVATNGKKEGLKPEKKKLSPLEIRNILIAKLPQLKANIMMLDDNEIQRIFYESIQNGGNSHSNGHNMTTTTNTTAKPESKPV